MQAAIRAGVLLALATSSVYAPQPAIAGPADDVLSPLVVEGEREAEFKAGSAKLPDGKRESKYSASLGLGVTSWWFTEVAAIWHKQPDQRQSFDAWEWENRFQLTETGKYPVDIGFLFEIERPRDRREGYEYRWGPLFQADLAPDVQANLNLLLEKHIRTPTAEKAELGYQWQLKYRWRPEFEFGVQGFGNVGPWSHWEAGSKQSHIAGPAVFGRVKLGGRQVIKYNAGVLFGLTDGSPRNTLRLQAEYEF